MNDQAGLERRYDVRKVNDTTGKHDDCRLARHPGGLMSDQTTDPLEPLDRLVDEWANEDADWRIPTGDRRAELLEALAAVRERLGEAKVREEFALQHRDGWIAGPGSDLEAMRELVADPHAPGAVGVLRRVVTTTRHESEWEAVE